MTKQKIFIRRDCFKYVVRILGVIAATMTLAVVVIADCERRILFVHSIVYGGRQFNSYISCGSSAGNFGYTCAEGGSCYENPNLTEIANDFCGCPSDVLPIENTQ